MKFKPAITDGVPNEIINALGSGEYAKELLEKVVEGHLGAKNIFSRPSEYYVQYPDTTVKVAEHYGVEVRLTGATRNGRTPTAIRNALVEIERITINHIKECRTKDTQHNNKVIIQVFCVIMLDADIHIGGGEYSNIIETEAKKFTV